MKNRISYIVILSLLVSSCVNTKKLGTSWLYSGEKVYKNFDDNSTTSPTTFIVKTTLNEGAKVKIEEKDDHLKVEFVGCPNLLKDTSKYDKAGKTYYHFPEDKEKSSNAKIRFMEISPAFQAISAPFKVRGEIDSIPYQVSKSVNLGLAYGWKFTHKVYNNFYYSDETFLKKRTNSFSVTPAYFLGPTTVDLKSSNTGGTITDDRTVLGINTGFMIVFGVNKLNLGISAGWDFGFGPESDDWIYQGKTWYGFVIAIDFIK